jgi:hypothetical protein
MSKRIVIIVSIFLLGLRPSLRRGGVTSEAVEAGVKFITQKFAREVAESFGEDAAERLGERLAGMAAKYGEAESVSAVEKVGPRLFQVVAEAGEDGAPKIIKLVNRCGDDAGYIVARPRSVAIFLKFGDPAADAMLKHKGSADSAYGGKVFAIHGQVKEKRFEEIANKAGTQRSLQLVVENPDYVSVDVTCYFAAVDESKVREIAPDSEVAVRGKFRTSSQGSITLEGCLLGE